MWTPREKEVFYVYAFSYKNEGEIQCYIGQTQNILQRLSTHRTNYRNMLKSIDICGLKVVRTRLDALELESILQEIYSQHGMEALSEAFLAAGGCWSVK